MTTHSLASMDDPSEVIRPYPSVSAIMASSSTGPEYIAQLSHTPIDAIITTPRSPIISADEYSNESKISPHLFLADLLRPHVRDYESMNLIIDYLGTFCDNALLEVHFNSNQNLSFTPEQMFRNTFARLIHLWPADVRVHTDLHRALRKFGWRALWNAIMDEGFLIRHYQANMHTYCVNRRHGSQRWIVASAAYADPSDYVFGWDVLRYLEPVATMQAFHADFDFPVVERDIIGEDMHWFSRSFFRHWDQAFQLLNARHPDRNPDDARYILTAIVQQGVHIVDVFRKYWYQGSEYGLDKDFGDACERAAKEAIDRQWKVEVDIPFGCLGTEPIPLHIRTILARTDHVRVRKILFNTVAYLVETIKREDLHRELFRMILDSVKDWSVETDNEDLIEDLFETIVDKEEVFDNEIEDTDGDAAPWSFNHVAHRPTGDRPFDIPPVILFYNLPDELPEPSEDTESVQSDDDEPNEEEFEIRWAPQRGRLRRLVQRLNPFNTQAPVSPFELQDVELEAYGPRIDPQIISHPCEPAQDDACPICLNEFVHKETNQENANRTGKGELGVEAKMSKLRLKGMRERRKVAMEKKDLQPMQLNLCNHSFHLACLTELLDQAYPKSGVVRCPCCRVAICPSRPTRVAHSRFGRIPLIGRLARP